MSTKFPDFFAALAAPFEVEEVRVRSQGGRQLHYITARTAMNRLDDIVGPESWWDDYTPGENSVMCRLTVLTPDGVAVTKCDAGGYAGMADSGDDDKSGYSDAFKRAAAKFGVARYLYRDGVPGFAREPGEQTKPSRPDPVPAASRPAQGHGGASNGRNGSGQAPRPSDRDDHPARPVGDGDAPREQVPRTGRALFAWTKDMEQRHEVGLLRFLNDWAKLQGFPDRMVDFNAEQVTLSHAEACNKLRSIKAGQDRN